MQKKPVHGRENLKYRCLPLFHESEFPGRSQIMVVCLAVRQEANVHLLPPLRSAEHQSSKRNSIPLKAAPVYSTRADRNKRWPVGSSPCHGSMRTPVQIPMSSNSPWHLRREDRKEILYLLGVSLTPGSGEGASLSQGNKAETDRAGHLMLP